MQAVEKPQNYQKTLDNTNNGAVKQINVSEADAKILPSVQKALKNIIAKEGFTLYKLDRRAIAPNGSNYMGDLYEIDIKGHTNEGYKEIHLFLKHIIPVEAIQALIDVNICYSHEVLFYNELSDVFNKLQENAKIPDGERFKIVKNYGCNQDSMILENLARKGFKTLYRMDVMPIKFAELSIAQLAKLHGLSFVLKHKNRDYFDNKIKKIESPLNFDNIDVWKPFVIRQFGNSTKYFGNGVQEKINQFLDNKFIEKFPKYFTGITDSIKCFCHGDFRISNVMFKDNNDEDSESILIDHQCSFYGSPVTDLLYFIYTGTDGKFRKAHMNNLKDLYHTELAKMLEYFDLDINDVYPKKVYEKDFEDSLDFGLMVALYISPFVFTAESCFPDFGKDSIEDISHTMDDRHEKVITEIVEEYLQWGIL